MKQSNGICAVLASDSGVVEESHNVELRPGLAAEFFSERINTTMDNKLQ